MVYLFFFSGAIGHHQASTNFMILIYIANCTIVIQTHAILRYLYFRANTCGCCQIFLLSRDGGPYRVRCHSTAIQALVMINVIFAKFIC